MANEIAVQIGDLAFMLRDFGGNIDRFLSGAVADVDAGGLMIEGAVKRKIAEKQIVGATGLYKDSIQRVPARLEDGRITTSVISESPYGIYVEFGTGPHRKVKSPIFWINVLGPWVHLVIAPSGGTNPKSGKKQTREQAERAIAIGAGRNIEKKGTKGHFAFTEAFEETGEAALDQVGELLFARLAAEIDAARAA